MQYRYALAGNPNCGKTTLFNSITGSNQYVGNWPGVTVEKKEGKVKFQDHTLSVVDLPGIYSLSPYSMEEIVARNFIIDEKPDLIINIADASNLERNLYLTLQLAELGRPMVVALNMIDIVEKRGDKIDCEKLSMFLDMPVIPISASKKNGLQKLLHVAQHTVEHATDTARRHIDKHVPTVHVPEIYGGALKRTLADIETLIADHCVLKDMPLRWSALKLIEDDPITKEKLELNDRQQAQLEKFLHALELEGIDREMEVADQKYKYICNICEQSVTKTQEDGRLSASDRIDRIVTHKYLAIPLFLALMLLIFALAFGPIGNFLTDSVDFAVNDLFANWVRSGFQSIGVAAWATGLVCDGIIAGLGAIFSFFPQILLLFFFLSLLEDSGYMSRAAFIMDRALHRIGLSGKSFVPMLMGFGCTVPAVMAARTLESEKDRRLTIMLTPFMSCSAKMPIYSLFIAAFFPKYRVLVVFSLYILGMLVAIVCAFILQKTVLRGGHSAFVMELPPYRMPTLSTLGLHLWDRIKDFLTKAGTILLGATIVIWFLQTFDFSMQMVSDSTNSMLGIIGREIAVIFKPLGFGDWKSSVALLTGLIAKETVVSTLGILHGTGGQTTSSLVPILRDAYSIPSALSFLTFTLLYIPCIAAVAAIRREMNSLKWTAGTLGFQMLVAWMMSFIVYQLASLIAYLV